MLSTTLIFSALSVLASVAEASPCKPLSTTATATTIETTSAAFSSETTTLSSSAGETSLSTSEAETTTTADPSSSTGVPTTTAEGPLLTNAGFDDGTTAPWELLSQHDDALTLGSGFEGPASGKVTFGIENGRQYSNLIIQKINKKALKAGSYTLEGQTLVDYYSEDGDGCSTIIAACIRGSAGDYVPIRDSVIRESAENSVGNWHQTSTTCKITQAMIDEDADINVVFGFFCANSAAYLDSVNLTPIEDAETTAASSSDTTTAAFSSEATTMMTTTAVTTEGSSTIAEATTTTTAENTGPTSVLSNGNFDLGTIEPWLSDERWSDLVSLGSDQPYQGPAYGKLHYTDQPNEAYEDQIYQKVDTKLLKAGSYHLAGYARISRATQSFSDNGCNSMFVVCSLGDPNNFRYVPGSSYIGDPYSAVNNWVLLETTCTFTDQMLAQNDYITISFSFICMNSDVNVDAVTFTEVV